MSPSDPAAKWLPSVRLGMTLRPQPVQLGGVEIFGHLGDVHTYGPIGIGRIAGHSNPIVLHRLRAIMSEEEADAALELVSSIASTRGHHARVFGHWVIDSKLYWAEEFLPGVDLFEVLRVLPPDGAVRLALAAACVPVFEALVHELIPRMQCSPTTLVVRADGTLTRLARAELDPKRRIVTTRDDHEPKRILFMTEAEVRGVAVPPEATTAAIFAARILAWVLAGDDPYEVSYGAHRGLRLGPRRPIRTAWDLQLPALAALIEEGLNGAYELEGYVRALEPVLSQASRSSLIAATMHAHFADELEHQARFVGALRSS